MRENYDACIAAAEALGTRADLHIANYGYGIEERLTGHHETASYKEFSYGVSHRGASVRIPWQVAPGQEGVHRGPAPERQHGPVRRHPPDHRDGLRHGGRRPLTSSQESDESGGASRASRLAPPFIPERVSIVARYMFQASYTMEALAALVDNPQDRSVAARALLQQLGAQLESFDYCLGDYDVMADLHRARRHDRDSHRPLDLRGRPPHQLQDDQADSASRVPGGGEGGERSPVPGADPRVTPRIAPTSDCGTSLPTRRSGGSGASG